MHFFPPSQKKKKKLLLRATLIDYVLSFTLQARWKLSTAVRAAASQTTVSFSFRAESFPQTILPGPASLPNLKACLEEVGLGLNSILSSTNGFKSLIKSKWNASRFAGNSSYK